jgi:hypothetical protein
VVVSVIASREELVDTTGAAQLEVATRLVELRFAASTTEVVQRLGFGGRRPRRCRGGTGR